MSRVPYPISCVFALAMLVGISSRSATAQIVANTSFLAPDGTRVLQHSVVVGATLHDVWDAFTTTDGLRAWAAPVVHAEFRRGGVFETSYQRTAQIGDSANIRNEYIGYIPLRMVAFRVLNAPPDFPHRELLDNIFTVVELERRSDSIKVTVSMPGYGNGVGFDALYRHFAWGNDWSLKALRRRFESGPADWAARKAVPER